MVVFGECGCVRAKWLYSGKRGCIRAEIVLFGQGGCTWAKWWYSGKNGCTKKKVVMGQKC